MTMPLHTEITQDEIKNEPGRFDFLDGVRDDIVRMDECHGTPDDDSQYVFLLWVDPDEEPRIVEQIQANIDHGGVDNSWWYTLHSNGCGFVVLYTWNGR